MSDSASSPGPGPQRRPISKTPAIRLCVHCGWTVGEFQAKRLLGCPQCYDALGDALLGEWLVLHPDLGTAAWPPQPGFAAQSGAPSEEASATEAELRERLQAALRREDYAEAARLKARLKPG